MGHPITIPYPPAERLLTLAPVDDALPTRFEPLVSLGRWAG